MNFTNSTSTSPAPDCRHWDEEFLVEKYAFTVIAIVLNLLSCPLTISMNVLVIVAVRTRHRLQTNCNILLACLAGTDLLVGILVQPSFLAGEVSLLAGLPLAEYCDIYNKTIFLLLTPSLSSLLHLALLSGERYLAMKYSLRYATIVTTPRLTTAIVCIWIFAVTPSVILLSATLPFIALFITSCIVLISLFVIAYCHIAVYFVSRRHMIQISAEQISREAQAKILKETKAAKTTRIIIGVAFLSFLPSFIYSRVGPFSPDDYFGRLFIHSKPVLLSCFLLNSLCNPIIYCWRSSMLRKAFIELLTRKANAIHAG